MFTIVLYESVEDRIEIAIINKNNQMYEEPYFLFVYN